MGNAVSDFIEDLTKDSSSDLETPQPDKAAFQIQGVDNINAQRDAIAANPVEVDAYRENQFNALQSGLGKLGSQLSARITETDLESDLEGQRIRNAVANFAFAPGATLSERLSAAAQGGIKANEDATKLATEQRNKLAAQSAFVRQAQIESQLQMKSFKAQAEGANRQTALALEQSRKAMELGQQELTNQYNRLRMEARNARELMNIDAMQANSQLNWQMATAGLNAANEVTRSLLEWGKNKPTPAPTKK
jgi:hypothetical protein